MPISTMLYAPCDLVICNCIIHIIMIYKWRQFASLACLYCSWVETWYLLIPYCKQCQTVFVPTYKSWQCSCIWTGRCSVIDTDRETDTAWQTSVLWHIQLVSWVERLLINLTIKFIAYKFYFSIVAECSPLRVNNHLYISQSAHRQIDWHTDRLTYWCQSVHQSIS